MTWINFGALGLVVIALLTGYVWAKPAVDRLKEDNTRLIGERDNAFAQRDAAVEVLQDRLIPVVTEFISTTRALLPVLQEVHRLQHMVPALQEFIDTASDLARREGGHPPDGPRSRR